jgi:predicted O-methyltransferase YrrM
MPGKERLANTRVEVRNMELIDPEVATYLDRFVPPRDPELMAMEEFARETRFPIIGPATGQLCYLLARMTAARRIFELGSGFGYSTAWFARAIRENGGGVVHHVVRDAPLSQRARPHLDALGFGDLIEYHVAEAVATLRATEGPFDLIFNDIDKAGYPASLPVIREKVRPGGVLIVDNMLWQGRIFDGADSSPETTGIRELTRLITSDPAWTASLIPIRDGVLVAYRR